MQLLTCAGAETGNTAAIVNEIIGFIEGDVDVNHCGAPDQGSNAMDAMAVAFNFVLGVQNNWIE